MSKQGISLFADLLSTVQNAREQLLRLSTSADPVDKVDCRLSAICAEINDTVKDEFMELISNGY